MNLFHKPPRFPANRRRLLHDRLCLTKRVGRLGERILQHEPGWAVLHDPEGHNVLLIQSSADG